MAMSKPSPGSQHEPDTEGLKMSALTTVAFSANIKLTQQDIEDAGGDLAQAVQNVVGGTGAQVYPETVEEA